MPSHHLVVPRTARYHTLGDAGAPRELWIACHGYGQLAARFATRLAPLVEEGHRLVAAPEALSRFYLDSPGRLPAAERRVGATWMTREDREAEIDDQIAYLDALHAHLLDGRAPRVVALGFSQGAATVSRWVMRSAARVDALVLWGALLPPDVDRQSLRARLGHAPLVLAAGTRDELLPAAAMDAEEARLRHAGLAPRIVRYDGGHDIEPEPLMAVAHTIA